MFWLREKTNVNKSPDKSLTEETEKVGLLYNFLPLLKKNKWIRMSFGTPVVQKD